MSEDHSDDVRLSRSQATEAPVMSIRYLRHRTAELERSIVLRACVEQFGLALGIANCASMLTKAQDGWASVTLGLMLVGLAYAWFEWRRHAAPRRVHDLGSAEAGVTFYIRELERKRDLHRTIWRWHLLPMAPGLIAVLAWKFFGDPQTRGIVEPWMIAAFVFAWVASALTYERFKAAHYQRELDALAPAGEGTGSWLPSG